MEKKIKDGFKDDGKVVFWTIPNVLSLLRIALIPLFVYLYIIDRFWWSLFILILSGITDVVDGFIARRFNMISAVGKALDPISDKLTQAAVLGCLISEHHTMLVPFLLMIVKEVFSGLCALMAIKYTGEVHGADWHGKLTTFSLYAMMALHLLWTDIPPVVSNVLIGVCVLLMLMSLILYSVRNIGMAKKVKDAEREQKI